MEPRPGGEHSHRPRTARCDGGTEAIGGRPDRRRAMPPPRASADCSAYLQRGPAYLQRGPACPPGDPSQAPARGSEDPPSDGARQPSGVGWAAHRARLGEGVGGDASQLPKPRQPPPVRSARRFLDHRRRVLRQTLGVSRAPPARGVRLVRFVECLRRSTPVHRRAIRGGGRPRSHFSVAGEAELGEGDRRHLVHQPRYQGGRSDRFSVEPPAQFAMQPPSPDQHGDAAVALRCSRVLCGAQLLAEPGHQGRW